MPGRIATMKSRILPLCLRAVWVALLALTLSASSEAAVNYDIVYVRAPRFGDNENSLWPEIFHPARLDPGSDLMLLHPNGTEEVLVRGGEGSVSDVRARTPRAG